MPTPGTRTITGLAAENPPNGRRLRRARPFDLAVRLLRRCRRSVGDRTFEERAAAGLAIATQMILTERVRAGEWAERALGDRRSADGPFQPADRSTDRRLSTMRVCDLDLTLTDLFDHHAR